VATAKGERASGAGRKRSLDEFTMMKALSHPIRLDALGELSYREISPAEFARERDEPVSRVAYHFRFLRDLGCIEVAWTRPAGGSTEHFYRRTETPVFKDEIWRRLPDHARRMIASTTLDGLVGRASQAIEAGTFTVREDAHITWESFPCDEQAWAEVTEILGSARDALVEAKEGAAERLAESDEPGFIATAGLTGFESPDPPRHPKPDEDS
jgi:DNA-binding transcriptional ArsR family regulator